MINLPKKEDVKKEDVKQEKERARLKIWRLPCEFIQ
jgi:hypothetical protein